MSEGISGIRNLMRDQINDSKFKRDKQIEERMNNNPGVFENESKPKIQTQETNIFSKINAINAPEPREAPLFSGKRAHDPVKSEVFEKPQTLNEDPDARFSARILKSTKEYIKTFKPIIPSKMRKNAGGGSGIEAIVEELRFYRKEEQEHIREILDFLRQTQNAEKNYKFFFRRGTEEELEAKQKFSKSISTLAFVLDLKKFSDQRLVQLMNAGLLQKEIYWEIHYYLHSEIYTKWKGRGLL